jgi:hypothetical protein
MKTKKKSNKSFNEQKTLKLIETQSLIIKMLSDYYMRTKKSPEIQEEMFPTMETQSCDCCNDPIYPIDQLLIGYDEICENFDSMEVEDMDIGLRGVPHEETDELKQSEGLLN